MKSTYGSLSDVAFSQAIEVMEELLDSYLPLEHLGLHALLNVQLDVKSASRLCDSEAVEVGSVALCDTYEV